MQLSTEDRFDLLMKWSIPPVKSAPKIRVLSALVPTMAPPAEFARALGGNVLKTTLFAVSVNQGNPRTLLHRLVAG